MSVVLNARPEARCWRVLAAAALIGTVLVGCGGGDEQPARAAPAVRAAPVAEAAPAPAPALMAPAAQPAVVTPCERPPLPPYGAQAALHAEQQATAAEFNALAEASRQQHAGTVPAADPFQTR